MHTTNMHITISLLLYAAVGVAASDDDTDFLLSIFSDVGPYVGPSPSIC